MNFTWESSSYSGGAWSTGGSTLIGRAGNTGTGTQHATLAMGIGWPGKGETEHYDGAAWSAGGLMITHRGYGARAGTQNAAQVAGGYGYAAPANTSGGQANREYTEQYNGTTWSEVADTPNGWREVAGDGTQNAAWLGGGNNTPGGDECSTITLEWNGSSWSEGGALPIGKRRTNGAGQLYAALNFGGHPNENNTYEYNGSVWSAGGSMTDGEVDSTGAGSQGAAFAVPGKAFTEEYNGTTWSSTALASRGAAPANGSSETNSAGTPSAGILFGGNHPGAGTYSQLTEEYAGHGVYKTLVVCALTGSQA